LCAYTNRHRSQQAVYNNFEKLNVPPIKRAFKEAKQKARFREEEKLDIIFQFRPDI
jgi:hypothetical protein